MWLDMLRFLLAVMLSVMGCHTFYDPDTAPLSEPATGDVGLVGGDVATVVVCEGEPNWTLCQQQAAQCGTITVDDLCGTSREIDCGECPTHSTCGADEPNVCGCRCAAEVGCLPEGAAHPDGSCRVCAETGWEVTEGAACSDGDPCTVDDVCQTDGTCAGVPRDCTPDECASAGSCDPETGRCVFEPVADGEPCTDDGLDCTADVCEAGRCAHQRVALTCVIEGMCVAQGEVDECLVCDVQADPFGWTTAPDGTPCLAGGGSCFAGDCVE